MRRQHAGFTLIELTVVLTVLSLVWLSVTCVLYTLFRADHRLRIELQSEYAIDRFAARLRLDAHAASSATSIEVATGGRELVLSNVDERAIHYGMSDEGVYRVVREGETVLHRDTFLTGRATSEWELHTPEIPSLTIVTWTSRDGHAASARVLRIKAAVASDHATVVAPAEVSS